MSDNPLIGTLDESDAEVKKWLEYTQQYAKIREQHSIFSNMLIQTLAPQLTDTQALTIDLLFNDWSPNSVEYAVGDRVRYDGVLYRCLQAHTSQSTWYPSNVPSLWTKCLIDPEKSGIPEGEQPDSTNPYSKGDKVSHNGKTWESLIDNNVWEPGVTGTESLWKEVP